MKNALKWIVCVGLLAYSAGCVVMSVYPYYHERDVVFDQALVGRWVSTEEGKDKQETWTFAKTDGQAYQLTIQNGDEPKSFDAHLFTLKNRRYLDLFPRARTDDTVPIHYLLKINQLETKLEFSMLDYEWLQKKLESAPKAIRHTVVPAKQGEKDGSWIVLTADTAELQRFILKCEKAEGAFSKSAVMTKKAP